MFDLQLQLLGDTDGVDEVVLRGSIADRNLVGFYLHEEHLIAAVVVGQAGDMVEELKALIREKPLLERSQPAREQERAARRRVRRLTTARLQRDLLEPALDDGEALVPDPRVTKVDTHELHELDR